MNKPWQEMLNRDVYINTARVLIAESRARGRTPFAHTLLRWAANARRRAMSAPSVPEQGRLFG